MILALLYTYPPFLIYYHPPPLLHSIPLPLPPPSLTSSFTPSSSLPLSCFTPSLFQSLPCLNSYPLPLPSLSSLSSPLPSYSSCSSPLYSFLPLPFLHFLHPLYRNKRTQSYYPFCSLSPSLPHTHIYYHDQLLH